MPIFQNGAEWLEVSGVAETLNKYPKGREENIRKYMKL